MSTKLTISPAFIGAPEKNYVRSPIATDPLQWVNSQDLSGNPVLKAAGGMSGTAAWISQTQNTFIEFSSYPMAAPPNVGVDASFVPTGGTYYYGFSVYVSQTTSLSFRLQAYDVSGAIISPLPSQTQTIPSGWTQIVASQTVPESSSGLKLGIELSGLNIATTFEMGFTEPWISGGNVGFFSGDTPNSGNVRYSWDGAPNDSASSRTPVDARSKVYNVISYSVQEASTPIAAGDSSGQTGVISFDIPKPDPDLEPDHPINKFGATTLIGQEVSIEDSRKGYISGTIRSVSPNRATGSIRVSATSRLNLLNVYGIQAQPFIGTLGDALRYYVSLASQDWSIFVDPALESIPAVFQGWSGELWFHLKQLATAFHFEITLLNNEFTFRPLRTHTSVRGRDIERTPSAGGGSLAQSVEVYYYNNQQITDQLVYPPGGWTEEVVTFNVNAGESIEETLELSASVTSVQQPVMQTFVSRDHSSSSVFTVTGDDGLPIQPAAFYGNGGSLQVEISEDTKSLILRVTAPTGLPNRDGTEISVYGISLSSDESTGRYSTLRIVGSGVAFDPQTISVRTGVGERETATEVGETVDNVFISTIDQATLAGSWAVSKYDGSAVEVSGSVVGINRAEEATTQNQVFGNLPGSRVWDEATRSWYRVREGSTSTDVSRFTGDLDLTYDDFENHYSGMTYNDFDSMFAGYNYRQAVMAGLR